MSELQTSPVRALRDNYIWLIHGRTRPGEVVVVDPGEAAPVERFLAETGLRPAAIFITHHHPDHTAGAPALAEEYRLPVYGPATEAANVVDHPLREGERVRLDGPGLEFGVLDIPGHTAGHIAFYGHDALFCGDTLFSAGCGRLFEGTPEQMLASLEKLAALPDSTRIHCGHEYTVANLDFGLAVEPDNAEMREYREWARTQTAAGRPSLPALLGRERQVNVFLRCAQPRVRRAVSDWCGQPADDTVTTFAAVRRWKDQFRG